MHAIQISSYGDPAVVLEHVQIPEPSAPGPSEVLIAMEFAPVDPSDLLMVRGLMPLKPELPSIIGTEGVGRVLAVGANVDNVKVGDRVLPPLFSLTWRERLVTPASGLFALPTKADVQQLSMLRVNPPTAALIMSEYIALNPGDWIIQNAANSGVGRSAIAIAKARGFKTINFVRRPDSIAELEAAGGDLVLVDGPGAAERVAATVGKGLVRLGLDGISGEATGRLASFLSPGGTLVGYALMSGDLIAKVGMLDLLWKDISLRGFSLGHTKYDIKIPLVLEESAQLISLGALHVPIAAVYPMTRIKEAAAHVERGGKVILNISNPS
ncbi:MAG: zinc-dependent alcohol dehydrogenase family protein [Janthinobacterium lividum]